jgi:hypothetical protein
VNIAKSVAETAQAASEIEEDVDARDQPVLH